MGIGVEQWKKSRVALSACCLVCLFLLPAWVTADEAVHGVDEPQAHNSHAFHKNTAGVFVGITHAGRRANGPALGLEYVRRINQNFSVGGVVEYTGGDGDFWVAVVPFGWHKGHWKLYVAPGFEEGHHGTEELLRLGVERAFELSNGWEVAPQINVDLVDNEDVWVLGVLIAKGF